MNEKNYDDIIALPAPASERHPRMSRSDRAAQFAPFAALVGYDSAIYEAMRLTEREVELNEDMTERLDRWCRLLAAIADAKPKIRLTYFVADKKKRGGSYRSSESRLTAFSVQDKTLTLDDKTVVSLLDIKSIDSELFHGIFDEGYE